MSSETKAALKILMQKPAEPLIVPRGDEEIVFQMPTKFYSRKYRKDINKISDHFEHGDATVIEVKNISIPEDVITAASEIDKNFSVLIPKHIGAAVDLIEVFKKAESLEDLLSMAAYARERVNPVLFTYALSVTLLHRKDTTDILLPNFVSTFPGKFIDSAAFSDIRKEANLLPGEQREPTVINRNFTATDREPEQAVAYFREDLGINLHHWHWHLVYPSRGGIDFVKKDRRGELFYYMHQQVLARYNTERLCNNMDFVKSLDNLRESIVEGYFPKLNIMNANRAWPPRFMYTFLRNIDRPSDRLTLTIDTCEQWLASLRKAIRDGQAVATDGSIVKLDPVNGIDILGNMVEATEISINRSLYGNLHNMAHVLIAFCHDPEDRFLESFGLMGDTATAMRDPVFYRWHNAINDLFVSHKRRLPPYTNQELIYNNVVITDLSVQENNKPKNEISTFWQLSTIDISSGLDFVDKGPLPISVAHLQHGQFTYTIIANNTSQRQLMGTVRLFMSAKYNRQGQVHRFDIERQMMIELDKFVVTLRPGSNTIQRKSIDSSVTTDHETTFKNVDGLDMDAAELNKHNFCSCGWPDHMLVPKGTPAGYDMNLFVMISNYSDDRIDQTPSKVCIGAESYCGLYDRKYPDRRSMGYPFDRPGPNNVDNLSQFLTPNMRVTNIKIKHTNRTEVRETRTKNAPVIVSP